MTLQPLNRRNREEQKDTQKYVRPQKIETEKFNRQTGENNGSVCWYGCACNRHCWLETTSKIGARHVKRGKRLMYLPNTTRSHRPQNSYSTRIFFFRKAFKTAISSLKTLPLQPLTPICP